MNDYDVLNALKGSLDEVTMVTPVEQIVATGRARRNRLRMAGAATAVVAATGVTAGVLTYANAPAAPPMQTVAYTISRHSDGTVEVTWDKRRYFDDREALQAALRKVGFPVLIRVGEFCTGPGDDPTLDRSGTGPGVDHVMKGQREANGKVRFLFIPSALPTGKQLFIGYLSPAQLAVTHGAPASVERLISTSGSLTCTTVAPPPHS